jgi:hypothetical protein
MRRFIIRLEVTDVSKEPIAFILKGEVDNKRINAPSSETRTLNYSDVKKIKLANWSQFVTK